MNIYAAAFFSKSIFGFVFHVRQLFPLICCNEEIFMCKR